jgi:hypothetical protein
MRGRMKTRKSKDAPIRKETPAVIYFWAFGLAIMTYAVARIALDGQPHPYHWFAGLVGGLAGIPVGWLWFRWRGDVF